MIESEEVQHRRMQVVHARRVLDGFEAKIIRGSIDGRSSITIPLARLSAGDRRYLETLGTPAPSHAELSADKQIGELLEQV